MNDRLAAFFAEQAFGLGVCQHAFFFQYPEQIRAASFDHKERDTLVFRFLLIVEGVVFIFDIFDSVSQDLQPFRRCGVNGKFLWNGVAGCALRVYADICEKIQELLFGFEIKKRFAFCGSSELPEMFG